MLQDSHNALRAFVLDDGRVTRVSNMRNLIERRSEDNDYSLA